MIIDPETIYQGLFEFVCQLNTAATPLKTMSRRWRHWDTIGSDPLPAFFQLQPTDSGLRVSQQKHFGQSKYEYHASLFFYFAVDVNDEYTPISPTLNVYLKAIDQLFQPNIQSPGGSRQQIGLGPQVENAWIDGIVRFDEGLINPPAILFVPITILTG